MSVKRIVAFLIFALMVYAGGFCLVYGFDELGRSDSRIIGLDELNSGTASSGVRVQGRIYQQVEYLGSDTMRPEILNIPVGEPQKRNYYVVPLKYEKDAEDLLYYVVCLSDEDSIERMEQLSVLFPQPEQGSGLEFYGVIADMDLGMRDMVYNLLITRTRLVGADGLFKQPMSGYYYNRILPWTVYERQNDYSALPAIIAGAALILGGAAGAVILGVKIYREKYRW